ncbi:glyoxalase [Devosia pacifica]|uniref:Glyoxalase n=1 Tax=Devosia pacifica TaxID=1335967 RepID=A0A918S8F7_9HYPH|nr:VOC family protein [Devosia pacifica]GHA30034.1 glyoxalase [Devosia pacifica]
MTMPIGPSFIALQVRDLAASTAFYADVFGFAAGDRNPPGAVVFTTSPIALAIREPIRPLPETGSLGTGAVIWIACHDADALHDLIIQRGGKVLAPVNDGPFGRFFVAADLDGYAITFHTQQN